MVWGSCEQRLVEIGHSVPVLERFQARVHCQVKNLSLANQPARNQGQAILLDQHLSLCCQRAGSSNDDRAAIKRFLAKGLQGSQVVEVLGAGWGDGQQVSQAGGGLLPAWAACNDQLPAIGNPGNQGLALGGAQRAGIHIRDHQYIQGLPGLRLVGQTGWL